MAINHEHPDPRDVRNPHTRYERRGINPRLVIGVLVLMVVSGVVIHFFVAGIWTLFERESHLSDVSHKPMLSWTPKPGEPPRVPPEPRLQPDPVSDLHIMREAEDNVLQTYGWVDKNGGVVRIPVARALDLVAQKGLPNFGGAPAAPAAANAKPAAKKSGGAGK